MTFAPPTLAALAAFWTAQGGVNLGIVGDADHAAKGYSYHLGRDQLASTAYSIRTARDRAGLSNAASAIDLGRLEGSLGQLRAFSAWLVERGQANAPGTSDIREIIYTADGRTVLRWDRERGHTSEPRPGEADNSHLTHTHVSWYRDAEARDHRTAFIPYFEELPMRPFPIAIDPKVAAIRAGAQLYLLDATPDIVAANVPAAMSPYHYRTGGLTYRVVEVTTGGVKHLMLARAVDCTLTPVPAPPGPDCTAAVAAEHQRTKLAAIAALEDL